MLHLAECQPSSGCVVPMYVNLPLVTEEDIERAIVQEQGA